MQAGHISKKALAASAPAISSPAPPGISMAIVAATFSLAAKPEIIAYDRRQSFSPIGANSGVKNLLICASMLSSSAHGASVKVKLEIDGLVVKTLKEAFERAGEDYFILICPDHPTPCTIKTHVADPVPYLLYTNVKDLGNGAKRYTEDEAAATGIYIDNGYTLLDRMLQIK